MKGIRMTAALFALFFIIGTPALAEPAGNISGNGKAAVVDRQKAARRLDSIRKQKAYYAKQEKEISGRVVKARNPGEKRYYEGKLKEVRARLVRLNSAEQHFDRLAGSPNRRGRSDLPGPANR